MEQAKTAAGERRAEKLRRNLKEAELRADDAVDGKVLAEWDAHEAKKRLATAEKRLVEANKTVAKLQARVKTLEIVQNALKDDLQEAKEAARDARRESKTFEGEAERLASERERYFAVIESLAVALARGAKS